MNLLAHKIHYKFYRLFCFVGIHDFVLLYDQPKLNSNNILFFECKCGKQKRQTNGLEFLKAMAKKNRVYLIKS